MSTLKRATRVVGIGSDELVNVCVFQHRRCACLTWIAAGSNAGIVFEVASVYRDGGAFDSRCLSSHG